MSMPVIILKSSPAICDEVPVPPDAMLTLRGLALAQAMKSGTVLAGTDGLTIITLAVLIDASNRRDVTDQIELLIERRVHRLRLTRLSSTRWKLPGVAVHRSTHCAIPLPAHCEVTTT